MKRTSTSRRFLKVFVAAVLLSTVAVDAAAYTYADECGPTWAELPMTYYVADEGSEQFADLEVVEEIFHDSFEEWQAPCCSDFRAEYGGRVQAESGLNSSEKDSVLHFYDEDWPAALGGPDTIAVTNFLIDEDCHIADAPIHFNSAHHQFDDGDGTGDADLQAITTHEVGHLLGLGHSEFLEATMFSHYVGGTSPRSLHDDDIDGICSLYPADCPCDDDGDCRAGQECDGQKCIAEICDSDDECDAPFSCIDGACDYPPCDDDGDCAEDRICQNQKCVEPCSSCRPCTEHADCGHQGYCRSFPHGGRCFVPCSQNTQCPGDSKCNSVDIGNEEYLFCTAPDPQHPNDYCAADYTCQDFDDDFEPCPGLGDDCGQDSFECSPANDLCVEREDESVICSCSCMTSSDCGNGHLCLEVSDGQSACIPGAEPDCESDGDCGESEQCDDGECAEREVVDGSGCATGAPTSPAPLLLLAAAVLVAARRSWRTAENCLTFTSSTNSRRGVQR